MVNMLTHFVNIHAHSSIKHAMRNSRVTGTIANKNEETKLPSILPQSFAKKKRQKFRTIGDVTEG